MNAKLSDPRGVPDAQIDAIVEEGKAVVVQSMSMHATEIGGTQMAVELVYDLLSRNDEEARRILDNVIFIEVPCIQSGRRDHGHRLVQQDSSARRTRARNPPWLYQKYAGHDNNRDAFQTNMPGLAVHGEAPVHASGSRGVRRSPPHGQQRRAHLPAAVRRAGASRRRPDRVARARAGTARTWRTKRRSTDSPASSTTRSIPAGATSGFHWITPFHNIAGMLTESAERAPGVAAVRCIPDQLRGNTRNLPVYEERDELPESLAGRVVAPARHRRPPENVGVGHARPGGAQPRDGALERVSQGEAPDRARRRGQAGGVSSSPSLQHDPLTAMKMINKLLGQGVEMQRGVQGFTHAAA